MLIKSFDNKVKTQLSNIQEKRYEYMYECQSKFFYRISTYHIALDPILLFKGVKLKFEATSLLLKVK